MKTIVLFLAVTVGLLLPCDLLAQGLFGWGSAPVEETEKKSLFYDLRNSGMEWWGGGMIPQDPTQEVPLGNGLLAFMAAGAGYAIVKSKEGKEE